MPGLLLVMINDSLIYFGAIFVVITGNLIIYIVGGVGLFIFLNVSRLVLTVGRTRRKLCLLLYPSIFLSHLSMC